MFINCKPLIVTNTIFTVIGMYPFSCFHLCDSVHVFQGLLWTLCQFSCSKWICPREFEMLLFCRVPGLWESPSLWERSFDIPEFSHRRNQVLHTGSVRKFKQTGTTSRNKVQNTLTSFLCQLINNSVNVVTNNLDFFGSARFLSLSLLALR